MGWKDLSYWIRGGLVGLIIALIYAPFMGPPEPTIQKILLVAIIFILIFALIFFIAGFIIKTSWNVGLKGAIIGLETYIIFVAYSFIAETWSCGNAVAQGYQTGMCGLFTAWVLYILWILIPLFAIIGWIYGKIKKN